MKPLTYISGPFTALSSEQQAANIQAACDLAQSVRYAVTPLVPHIAILPIHAPDAETEWNCAMAECLVLLAACDAVLMLPTWETSRGARIEHERALEWGIPVFTDPDALVRWAKGERVAA